ncbi:hypothetical protein D3C72_968900 [compost metagenome]
MARREGGDGRACENADSGGRQAPFAVARIVVGRNSIKGQPPEGALERLCICCPILRCGSIAGRFLNSSPRLAGVLDDRPIGLGRIHPLEVLDHSYQGIAEATFTLPRLCQRRRHRQAVREKARHHGVVGFVLRPALIDGAVEVGAPFRVGAQNVRRHGRRAAEKAVKKAAGVRDGRDVCRVAHGSTPASIRSPTVALKRLAMARIE